MTACRNKASRAVTAALVGVLSVGAVPMVAMAAGVNDGASLMFVTAENAFSGAQITGVRFKHGGSSNQFVQDTKTGVWEAEFEKNEPAILDAFTVSMSGTTASGSFQITASDPYDDYEVAYYHRGADGKNTGDELTGDISAVGDYVAVVTAVDGNYKGGVIYIPFSITPIHVSSVTVNEPKTVTYNAEKHDFTFKFNGVDVTEGIDYTVKYVPTGQDATDANVTDVKDAGTYKAVITGMGNYAGTLELSDVITVSQLDLSKARIEGTVSSSETEPTNPFAIWISGTRYSGDDAIIAELSAELDSDQQVWMKNGTYTYSVQAADPDEGNIIGKGGFTAVKVGQEISFKYGSEALPESYEVFVNDASTAWDTTKVSGFAADGTVDGATIDNDQISAVVYDANGDVKTFDYMNANPGSYTVVYLYGGAPSYDLGGMAVVNIDVYQDAVNADANAAVLYDTNGDTVKEVVSSISKTYDGNDIYDDIDIYVEDSNGVDVTSACVKKIYNADGIEVKKVIDAGTYTLKVTSADYKLSGTTEMTITVAPKSLETIRSGAVRTKSFDHAGVSTVEYLPWKENGYAITKVTSFDGTVIDGLGLQYKDGDSWVDMNPQFIQNVLKVTILKDGAKVEKITDEGVYTVHFEARNEDAANNYVVPADLVVTCVKDSHLLYADVTYTDYFADAVAAVNDLGVMSGYTDVNGDPTGVFGATNSLTRGQVATILYRLANGEGLVETEPVYNEIFGYETGFEDCNGKAFYAQAVAWAKSVGVVEGYVDGTFRPEQAVTRQEFATMLKNYEQLFGDYSAAAESVLDKFSDASEAADWAVDDLAWAVEEGILSGNLEGELMPADQIIRADAAVMIARYVG